MMQELHLSTLVISSFPFLLPPPLPSYVLLDLHFSLCFCFTDIDQPDSSFPASHFPFRSHLSTTPQSASQSQSISPFRHTNQTECSKQMRHKQQTPLQTQPSNISLILDTWRRMSNAYTGIFSYKHCEARRKMQKSGHVDPVSARATKMQQTVRKNASRSSKAAGNREHGKRTMKWMRAATASGE